MIVKEDWIDISEHQGPIDFAAVAASGVKGVVIRAGYGDDESQIDYRFLEYIRAAIAAGLKVAVYWFNYFDSVVDALKEWSVFKKIIEPFRKDIKFVAADYEYASKSYYRRIHGEDPTRDLINQMVDAFLNAAKADGWDTRLYTNIDYSRNVFSQLLLQTWKLWVAYYSGDPGLVCDIQQTGSTGHVPGIAGNVDMDTYQYDYNVPVVPEPTPAPQQLPERHVYYQVRTEDGRWHGRITDMDPDFSNPMGYAGVPGQNITDVAICVSSGYVVYQVHICRQTNQRGDTVHNGYWLPKVTHYQSYNLNDPVNGYAGKGEVIDLISAFFYTPAGEPVGYAQYRVKATGSSKYYPFQVDDQVTESPRQDGYAGDQNSPIDRFQIHII